LLRPDQPPRRAHAGHTAFTAARPGLKWQTFDEWLPYPGHGVYEHRAPAAHGAADRRHGFDAPRDDELAEMKRLLAECLDNGTSASRRVSSTRRACSRRRTAAESGRCSRLMTRFTARTCAGRGGR
jgi:hypothetical protein